MTYYSPGVYFLTGSTFLHKPYFKYPEQKQILLDQISKLKREKDIQICAFSIQINHYHLVFYSRKENEVSIVKQYMHGGTSFLYRKMCKIDKKDLWGSKKTIYIKSLEMYWKIIGYVCGNLLKHKEVSTFEELKSNPFSSYEHFVRKYGDDMVREIIYRVIEIEEETEGDINVKEMNGCSLKYIPDVK